MKLALVTTPWDAPGAHAELSRALARHLWEHCAVAVFVERQRAGAAYFGVESRPAPALVPREFDHVLYLLADQPEHAFMVPLVRALGGCVALQQWSLTTLAWAAYPALARGGWRGTLAALREGGPAQARAYWHRQATGLTLNRSIVRFGDTFLVPTEELRRQVLEERNAPTPIGVVPWPSDPSGDWAAVARSYVELLERFPAPRTARKGLLTLRIRERLREQGDMKKKS
jgi:hypothetical protein